LIKWFLIAIKFYLINKGSTLATSSKIYSCTTKCLSWEKISRKWWKFFSL